VCFCAFLLNKILQSWSHFLMHRKCFHVLSGISLAVIISVRPILRIGEYSLVALQYRRIRYIGLRVSADTDTPAAITANSNRTRRLKHGPRRQNVTTNEAGISIHIPQYRLQV